MMMIVVVDVELKIGPTIGREVAEPSDPPTVIVGIGRDGSPGGGAP